MATRYHPVWDPPVVARRSFSHNQCASAIVMDAPNDDRERREPGSRPLSPVLLDFQSGTEPPLSQYNQPHFPPNLYNIPARSVSHHFPPVRPFRQYNYLEAHGEDLGSRQYTLGPDNLLELNQDLTNAYRQAAQRASHLPQLTGTYTPSENLNIPPVSTGWLGGGGYTQNNPPTARAQTEAESEELRTPVASNSRVTLEMLLPPLSPNSSRSSHEAATSPISSASPITPITPPTPTADSRPRRRPKNRRPGPTQSDKCSKWKCEECNKPFFRKAERDRHLKTSTAHRGSGNGQYKCKYCTNTFTRDDARVRHARMCEGNPNKEEGGKGKKGKGKEKEQDDDDMEEL